MRSILRILAPFAIIFASSAAAAPLLSFSDLKLYDVEASEQQSFALDTAAIKPCPNSDSLADEPFRELSLVRLNARSNLSTDAYIEKIKWIIPGIGASSQIQLHYLMPSKIGSVFELPFAISNSTDTGKILFGSSLDLTSFGFKNVKLIIRSRDGSGNRFIHRLRIGIHFAAIDRCLPN